MDYRRYIESNPEICHGKLCFKGTRIMVHIVLEALANGVSEDELLKEYPSLTKEHIRAAIAYSAEITKNEMFIPYKNG